ncbi:MAG: helix-turn-helix domain-containing protein [Candidatus Binatia bacterium]
MAGPYKRWRDIRDKKLTPEQRDRIAREVEQELVEMDLQEVRTLLGKTQVEMAEALNMTQPEVSRLERRHDVRLSTLKRAVEALGGELEVFAAFGDKRVRLRAVG